ncbi:MAG TPA: AbrB/MazE/SpoVT family DNA-binding domain-containing protein [Candidatus Sulfotelmatobacter sp.]|nr:AbrB/MazE/SpoVT family DNA-binding domain-containing protein [Candidatus Sulfotelmatobacter sp.]
MPERFRLKVAARRQVTLPAKVLRLLNLAEGDVLEITITGNSFVGRGLKLVPAELFTAGRLEELQKREQQMAEGEGIEAKSRDELLSKLSKPTALVGSSV